MPTETRSGRRPTATTPRFNEAVGSCPRKRVHPRCSGRARRCFNEAVGSCPRKRQPRLGLAKAALASMRPWARAHGNVCVPARVLAFAMGFNEAVGSCPRKRTERRAIVSTSASFNEAVGSCPRKHGSSATGSSG